MTIIGLSDSDIKKLMSSKDPSVKRAGEIIHLISSDLESRMFVSISGVIDAICRDLDKASTQSFSSLVPPEDSDIQGLINWRDVTKGLISRPSILDGDKEDKIFERVNSFMKNYSDYAKAIAIGSERMQKIGISEKGEASTGVDAFTRRARSRGKHTQAQS